MKVYLGKNQTVVSNFQEGVEGDIDQGLRMTCNASGKVTVTIVGS